MCELRFFAVEAITYITSALCMIGGAENPSGTSLNNGLQLVPVAESRLFFNVETRFL
jgi:hypothetical protein